MVPVNILPNAGQHLRTLRVPGTGINALAWEKGGLRIALAVESFVYFANVQPNYHWAYFAGTVVYAFSKPDRAEACVVFWDVQTHETHAKYVRRLVTVKVCKLLPYCHVLLLTALLASCRALCQCR
jgi:WD repeat-containing protein 35